MSRAGTHWSEADMKTAKTLFDDGLEYDEIGEVVGRSGMACYDMLRKYFKVSRATPAPQYDGPPIGITMECAKRRRDCEFGSAVLREALLDLFSRTARRYQVGMDDAMAAHLGYCAPARIPGTERIFKTAAVERMAA